MKQTTISSVACATSNHPTDVPLESALQDIRSGKHKTQIEQVRAAYKEGGKKQAGQLKKHLPAILFSGRFSERNDAGIQQHSGILVADLDELGTEDIAALRDKLKEDSHVLFVFLSPTGSGLKVGFKVPADADRHSDSFAAVNAHVKRMYGEEIDQVCKNLSRLCFVSHDPDLYVNWSAEEMEVSKEAKPIKLTNHTDLAPRKRIAEELFGPVDWDDDTTGIIKCPGEDSHTNPDGTRDCQIHIDGVPNIHCFHSSCAVRVEEATTKLKRKITGEVTASETHQVYYDANNKYYWLQNNRGGWITNNEGQASRALRSWEISDKRREGELTSPVDDALLEIQQDKDVQYAGPLAGYMSGMHEVLGRRILVTESPQLIEPVQGTWPIFGKVIDGLLCADGPVQQQHFFGWLKVAIEALRAGKRRPGQALTFCGVADGGKSLLQSLITLLLGGRPAKPYQFMAGQTSFNADLFGAEHLMIEDDQSSTDIRSRRAFGAMIKAFAVNDVQHCHGKNRQAIELTPFWRVTISVNNEPEHLQVLPPLDDSLEDKIMLLKASKRSMPMPTTTVEDRLMFKSTLTAELPAFVYFLLNEFVVPEEIACPRFGVTHYHHPTVLGALADLAPENLLLSYVDVVVFAGPLRDEWHGTAEELQRILCDSDYAHETRQLLRHTNTCGTYLSRLAKQKPPRVISQRTENRRDWLIRPPGCANDGMTPSFVCSEGAKVVDVVGEDGSSHGDIDNLPSCRHEDDKPAYEEAF